MPAKLPFLKSNRSQASVGSSTDHSSTVSLGMRGSIFHGSSVCGPGVHADRSADRQEGGGHQYRPQEEQQKRILAPPFSAHSPAQRQSANVSLERPPVNVAASVNAAEASLSNDTYPDQRYYTSYSAPTPPQPSPQPQESKKSLRTRLGNVIGHTHRESAERLQPAGYNKPGVGRSVSVRKKEVPTGNRYSTGEGQTRPYPQGWSSQQEPRQHLAPSKGRDEDSGLDPFLVQDRQQSPVPPPKDSPYSERYDQNGFPRPSLARVNTNPDYLSQSSQHHSPEQSSGGTRHSFQNQNHSPLTSQQQQEAQLQYQAFHNQQAPSSDILAATQVQQQTPDVALQQQHQLHDEESRLYQQQQQAFGQYQQQQQQQHEQRPPHYAGPDLHQGLQQDDSHGRPSSQQQQYRYHQGQYQAQDLQGPPPPPHQDTKFLQSLRPPSQQQQYSASSPVNQHHDPYSTDGQSHLARNPAQDPTLQKAPGTTPIEQNSGRGNFEAKQQGQGTFSPPSRQGSDGLEQPQPGRGHVQSLIPGIASFSANVVPPTSQGHPYKNSQQLDGEMSRSTPPPARGPSDMTEDDVVQMQKEYKELSKPCAAPRSTQFLTNVQS